MQPIIRNYAPDDLEPIVALLNAAESVDHSEDGTSIDELRIFLRRPASIPERMCLSRKTRPGILWDTGISDWREKRRRIRSGPGCKCIQECGDKA